MSLSPAPIRPAGEAARPSFRARFSALGNIPPYLALVWRAAPGLLAATLLLRLARALVPIATLWIGKLIIDEIVRLSAIAGAPGSLIGWWEAGLLTTLAEYVLLEFALAIGSDLIGRLIGLIDSLLSERLVLDLSMRMLDHAAQLDLEDFEDAGFQDRLERARRQAAGRTPLMGQLLTQMQNIVTIASFAGGLLAFNPWLVVLLIVSLVPAFLGEAHFNARSYSLDFRRTPERRELDYLLQLGAGVDSAKEVKIFDLHRFLADRYEMLSRRYYTANRAIQQARAGWGALFSGIGSAGYYAAYALVIAGTLTGDLSIGDLTFLAGSFLRLRGLLEGLLTSFSSTAAQALYLEDLFSFFRVQPEIVSREGARPLPRPITKGFEFRDVGFAYPGSDKWAVRHLNFTLDAGETLALVGENGAGKTTLVKLLARLYDPDEGAILLDGVDLRDYDLDDYRSAIGVIFQDFVRYNLTAGDNIAVGRIEARGDHARIEAAAESAMAAPVIERLPDGYDQMIGKRFQNGVELSGGEWQKIAIARAYMRGAQVLILDEPTAALDARSEFEVFQRFNELSRGRTAVLISHRFSSVRMADRILVMANGTVEASGTHAELLAQPGRYRELYELQAAGYR